MSDLRAHDTLGAYERWAPTYPPVAHNPLMRGEERAMRRHWPALRGRRVLDLACGSGRYARMAVAAGAAQVVATDFSPAMLARSGDLQRVRADMASLPFVAAAFDAVVCGLAVGHVAALDAWMRECARVLRPGGVLLYSDFHPDAAAAGLVRAFEDESGATVVVPHVAHAVDAQRAAALAAGLAVEALDEIRAGHDFDERFPDSERFYARWSGLPLLLVARLRR